MVGIGNPLIGVKVTVMLRIVGPRSPDSHSPLTLRRAAEVHVTGIASRIGSSKPVSRDVRGYSH
jgi:hypothetical protein